MAPTAPLKNPRWLVVVAWAAFLCTIPSALWRVLMITGLMPGTEALRVRELTPDPSAAYAYVFGLSIVQLATGFLTIGLIRPWGERLFGRRIPVLPVVVAGIAGGLAVVALFDVWLLSALAQGMRPDYGLVHGAALAFMVACYVPVFFWGPLELASVYGYWRRRTAR